MKPHTASPGAVCSVTYPGKHSVSACIGSGSVELESPLSTDSVFNVGSVAKQITAHMAISAAQGGLIGLRDPVAKYLPQVKIPGVKVSELINHQSGIRDAESLLSLAGFRQLDHYTSADLFALATRQQTRAVAPGTFLYSNTNYLILTRLIETIYDAKLDTIAGSQIFQPNGMTSAQFKSDPRSVIPHSVSSYMWDESQWNNNVTTVNLPGPGSLWCTIDDLNRWLTRLYLGWQKEGSTLPTQDLLPYVPADQPGYVYGTGMYGRCHTESAEVFHYGHENGFSAAVQLTSNGRRIVCLSNSSRLRADHILAKLSIQQNITAPDELAKTILESETQPRSQMLPRPQISGEHEPLGTFTCSDVPGSLRITRKRYEIFLWRRGTADQLEPLCQTGKRYCGSGYQITSGVDLRTSNNVSDFTLDLQRAPNLLFHKVS